MSDSPTVAPLMTGKPDFEPRTVCFLQFGEWLDQRLSHLSKALFLNWASCSLIAHFVKDLIVCETCKWGGGRGFWPPCQSVSFWRFLSYEPNFLLMSAWSLPSRYGAR